MREAIGWETLECRRHLATSQLTTSSTSPSLAPSGPLILARAQNTPLSSDTSPPTPMPTSTPSSLAQSLYGTICLASTAVTATSPEAHETLYIHYIFVPSSIFWIITCVYIRQLWNCKCAVRYPVKCILIDILLLASCIVVTLRGLKYKWVSE